MRGQVRRRRQRAGRCAPRCGCPPAWCACWSPASASPPKRSAWRLASARWTSDFGRRPSPSLRLRSPPSPRRLRLQLGLRGDVFRFDVLDRLVGSGRTRRIGLDLEGRVRLARWLWADADVNGSRGRNLFNARGTKRSSRRRHGCAMSRRRRPSSISRRVLGGPCRSERNGGSSRIASKNVRRRLSGDRGCRFVLLLY